MFIESALFEARHRENKRRICFRSGLRHQTSHVDRRDRGVEVEMQCLFVTRLAIRKAGELFGVAEDKLNGLITNDKFCLSRWVALKLSWWRRPLRLRH